MIPIYKPYLPTKTLSYAHDAINSTWISSHGKYLSMTSERLKEITNSKFVVLTNNGTSATHLVAHSLFYKYPNIKNLVVPSNVYIAAWNMFISTPKFKLLSVDSDLETWNFDLESILQTLDSYRDIDILDQNTAILAVHNLGNIINVPELQKKLANIPIIEDNCEGFLGSYNSLPSGKSSLSYSVSFFGNKTLTSGEGGAFFTDDEEIFEEINRVRAHGITPQKFIFDGLGYNYRMTNIQAALLYGQLEIKEEIQEKKKIIFDLYRKELKDYPGIHLQKNEEGTINPNWMFGVRFDLTKDKMDQLQLHLHYNDIETRPMFPPINYHSHLSDLGNFPISKKLYESIIILPSYPDLMNSEVTYICNTIKNFLK